MSETSNILKAESSISLYFIFDCQKGYVDRNRF